MFCKTKEKTWCSLSLSVQSLWGEPSHLMAVSSLPVSPVTTWMLRRSAGTQRSITVVCTTRPSALSCYWEPRPTHISVSKPSLLSFHSLFPFLFFSTSILTLSLPPFCPFHSYLRRSLLTISLSRIWNVLLHVWLMSNKRLLLVSFFGSYRYFDAPYKIHCRAEMIDRYKYL